MSTALLRLIFISLILFSFSTLAAQSVLPYQNWKTFETRHFNVHYTKEYREWALTAAQELEASAEVINQSQNRTLPVKVDVVVFDPLNDSNGFALPFSTKPIMALYATPPLSDSIISNSSSWQQLLALHEYVHLVHLAQPSRNGLSSALAKFWDIYDIALREDTERWVAEGYATLQESKLTGRGRLYDTQVEAMIRQFAREGALPKYSELNKVEGSYRIGSMAYLVGVRFFHWLEDNYSEQALDSVWNRLRAKKRRDFKEAFTGVFGDSPEYLYQRFIAEYTYQALLEEKETGQSNARLWFDGTFDLTSPVVNPSKTQIAFVETNRKGDSHIKVLDLASDGKAKETFESEQKELLESDPQDTKDSIPHVFNNRAKYELHERDYAGIRNLRWLDDEHIIFSAKSRDADGRLHQDLFRWDLESGGVQQMTERANLRRFDVSSDGKKLIAERTEFGKSGLLLFNMADFTEGNSVLENAEMVAPFSIGATYDFPRFSPNGQTFAFLKTEANQPWSLYIQSLTDKSKTVSVLLPNQYQFLSYPQWSTSGEYLYYVAGKEGKLSIYRYSVVNQTLDALSSGQEMVSWPLELNKTKLFDDNKKQDWLMHISIKSRGPDLFVKPMSELQIIPVTDVAKQGDYEYLRSNTQSKVVMPAAVVKADSSIGLEKEYDIWKQDITALLTGTEASASYGSSEIGIKGGDLLQRFNWQVSLMEGTHDVNSGYSASLAWHGWPIKLTGHVYQLDLSESVSDKLVPEVLSNRENYLNGFYLSAERAYGLNSSMYRGQLAVSYVENLSDWLDTQAVKLSHRQSVRHDRVKWGWSQHSVVEFLSGDADRQNTSTDWRGFNTEFELSGHLYGISLALNHQYSKRTGTDYKLLSFGGIESGTLSAKGQLNVIFSPEFALGAAVGNEYENTRLSLSKRNSAWKLYYSEPRIDGEKFANVLGLSGRGSIDIFGAGLTNVTLRYGLAEVRPVMGKKELEGWLSWFYQF